MPNFAETLDHNAAVRRGSKSKPVLSHVRIEQAENGGHSIEHHFESRTGDYHEPKTFVFGKSEGSKVLKHLAEHLGIPHDMGKTAGSQSQEPEKEADED